MTEEIKPTTTEPEVPTTEPEVAPAAPVIDAPESDAPAEVAASEDGIIYNNVSTDYIAAMITGESHMTLTPITTMTGVVGADSTKE